MFRRILLPSHIDDFSMKLLMSPSAGMRAEALGMPEELGEGLLTLRFRSVDICRRTLKGGGSQVHAVFGYVDVIGGGGAGVVVGPSVVVGPT